MKIDYDKPEAKIYDLYVDGKQQQNWVAADESADEYELFVEDLPWRGGGRIPDSDNPTGYQTLKQKGKVEFKRNDLPDPSVSSSRASGNDWEGWGNYCGAVDGSAVGVSLQDSWDALSPAVQQFISERMGANGGTDSLLPLPSFDEYRKQDRAWVPIYIRQVAGLPV